MPSVVERLSFAGSRNGCRSQAVVPLLVREVAALPVHHAADQSCSYTVVSATRISVWTVGMMRGRNGVGTPRVLGLRSASCVMNAGVFAS